jgi:hypothetical protein
MKVELDDNATATIYEETDGEGFKYQVAFINSEGASEESEFFHGCATEEIAISEARELYRDLSATV